MVTRPEVLAIVPARGGSKGIPRKNIRDFAGAPLLAYSITAGLQAESVSRIIVSTDDPYIAEVGRAWGAQTPFLRPPELARDETTDLPVFQHALNWLADHEDYHPEIVVQLRPTSPLRPVGLVDAAVARLLAHPNADCVRGVVPAGQNPHKMWRLDTRSGVMQPLLQVAGISEPYNAPRQVLPMVHWQTGHVDAIRARTILEKSSMTGDTIIGIEIDPRYTVDIDTPYDWLRYEWIVYNAGLEMVDPTVRRRPLPKDAALLVMDFDGVLTDNRVFVDGSGRESVAAYRSDSIGLNRLRAAGVEVLALSTETDPVVKARCDKINLPAIQGVVDKAARLSSYLAERQIDPARAIYLGNDINDVPCFPLVGCAVVVADALPEAARQADIRLSRKGGYGAVRELCDMILSKKGADLWQM